jgi:hypothetical protein
MAVTKQDIPFVWLTACERSCKRLKKSFVLGPILPHFDQERKIVLEANASNRIMAGVLSQYDNDNILHPVAYSSR